MLHSRTPKGSGPQARPGVCAPDMRERPGDQTQAKPSILSQTCSLPRVFPGLTSERPGGAERKGQGFGGRDEPESKVSWGPRPAAGGGGEASRAALPLQVGTALGPCRGDQLTRRRQGPLTAPGHPPLFLPAPTPTPVRTP